jgi:hypothetical protein
MDINMELQSNNIDAFIQHCIQKARAEETPGPRRDEKSISSTETNDDDQNSLLLYYQNEDDSYLDVFQTISSQETRSMSTPSLCSSMQSNIDSDDSNTMSQTSVISNISTTSLETSQNGDTLQKSFLQLKGISVANFNICCNFHIAAALQIMIQYDNSILAIQEHTTWNKTLSDIEITSIE